MGLNSPASQSLWMPSGLFWSETQAQAFKNKLAKSRQRFFSHAVRSPGPRAADNSKSYYFVLIL